MTAAPAVTIRPLAPGDLQVLWVIFREVVEAGETYAHDATTTYADFETYWLGRGGEQWIAVAGSRIVGGYTLRPNHPGRGAHVGTASYLVSAAARGTGIGRALGVHSLERARAAPFDALQFNFVVSTNAAAVHLWHALGFRTLATLPAAFAHPTRGKVDALVLFREL